MILLSFYIHRWLVAATGHGRHEAYSPRPGSHHRIKTITNVAYTPPAPSASVHPRMQPKVVKCTKPRKGVRRWSRDTRQLSIKTLPILLRAAQICASLSSSDCEQGCPLPRIISCAVHRLRQGTPGGILGPPTHRAGRLPRGPESLGADVVSGCVPTWRVVVTTA